MSKAKVRKGADMRVLLAWAKELGFECGLSGGSHLVFRRPNTMPVFASLTPSCQFARHKTKRDLKYAIQESEQRQQLRGVA
ncbi:hypothetical protein D3C75_581620 [compost metagenome]